MNQSSYEFSRLQQPDLSKTEIFWKQAFKGFTAPTPLVVAHAVGGEYSQESGHGEENSRLSEAVTSALKSLSQEHELTINTLVQGAWALLLSRYSGEEDVVFGATRACRRSALEGAESMVGLFINILPIRVQVSPDMSLLPWLKELQAQWITLRDYEHTPLSKVQEWLDIPGGASLFESLLVFENYQMDSALQGLSSSWENREFQLLGQTNFPLTVRCSVGTELLVTIKYDSQRFEQATITRMLGHLQTLLEGMVTNFEQRLADMPLLTQAERHQLLVEWNDTQRDYPDTCIHQIFEAQVERTPDALAVAFEDEQLTYRELNVRANQLAHHLQALGVEPEVLVGIFIERSLEMVVGLLAILKAGGAYVPLDPAFPSERLSSMLSDSQVPVLLTQEKLVARLPEHKAHVVCLDADWEVISQNIGENPVSGVKPNNLAYVIYTSGSTGKPKGVAIEQKSIVNYLNGILERLDIGSSSNFALVSTIAADLGNTVVFPSLCTGGCLHVISQERASNPNAFADYFSRHLIDYLKIVPSHLAALQTASRPERVLPRRRLIVGGEASRLDWVESIQVQAPHCTILNHYGPTEATVGVLTYQVEKELPTTGSSTLPLGRPIANTQIYILDRYLQPVPIGIPGELHIGGTDLARGYLNRPELTAEKFIPNPFSDQPDARLYKTGDLACYLPDGNIEYLGRIDHQVKIRGFRIELGEIQAVLAQHPTVREILVIAREDVPGDKRLVAYVVPNREQVPKTSQLRSFLKEKLPDYMVPSAFVILEALPLTPNGKVDRSALPSPEQVRQEPEETFVPPRNELELQLTKIWEKVLGIQPIGVRDNFFELGGHSLLAVRLLTEIEKVFGKNLPLATFFEAQTLEQLASVLRQKEESAPMRSLVMIQPGSTKPPLFCIHAIWGNVLFYRKFVRYVEPDQPFYALQAQGLDGKQPPRTSVTAMAAHYIQEIRSVQPEGPYFLGGYSFGGLVAFEIAQQLHAQGQKIALLAIFDTAAPGYSKPTYDSASSESLTFGAWSFFHLRKLLRLNIKDQLTYLRERLLWHLTAGQLSIFYRIYLRQIQRSPQQLRLIDVAVANNQAAKSYVPQVYPGRLTLLQASQKAVGAEDDPEMGWGQLTAGGVEIHEIPGSHTQIMEEPQVQLVAEKLHFCLHKAQAECREN